MPTAAPTPQTRGGLALPNACGTPREVGTWHRWAYLGPSAFLACVIVLRIVDIRTVYEPSWLMPTLNIVFYAGCSLLAVILAARAYLAGAPASVLALGCGMLVLGSACVCGSAFMGMNLVNAGVTTHNVAGLLAGVIQLVGAVSMIRTPASPRFGRLVRLVTTYSLCSFAVAVIAAAAWSGLFPVFVSPAGTTPLRSAILTATAAAYVFAAVPLAVLEYQLKARFLRWYWLGLVLIAIGMAAVGLAVMGSPLSWTGRIAQAAGQCYILVGLLSLAGRGGGKAVASAFRDVEQVLQEAEERLEQHRRRLAWVLDQTGVGLWLNELPLGRLNWDHRTCELFFVPPGVRPSIEMFWSRLHPDDRESTRLAVEAAIRDRTLYEIDHRVINPRTGEIRWLRSAGQAAYAPDGTPIRFDGINYDITERKQMEEQRDRLLTAERAARGEAEKAVRIKDEFLATVSHELRNPLNAILGWTRLLAKGSVEVGKAVDIIGRSASSLAQIIADLLDMSRIVSGKTELKPEQVDIVALVGNALDGIRLAADAKSIRVDTCFDTSLPLLTCDPGRIQQVVHNLLNNAVKFTPDGGCITISLRQAAAHVEIVVRDNGQGIPREFLPYVFDRFRQADQSIGRNHGGLGLGLAIVKHLVELHGGSVRAESDGEGHGATFTVALACRGRCPSACDPSRSAAPTRSDLPHDGAALDASFVQGRRILVIDDDPENCELVSRVLGDSGATILTATSGAEALGLLEKDRVDLIISDIGMPGMDGYEFVRRLRAMEGEQARIPCVALTAFARPEDREEARRAGFDDHLTKPFTSPQLARSMAGLGLR